jgi:hypothetical protein
MKVKLSALDLLFPKVRTEILRILFSEPKKQRYVRELRAMSELALRIVQEELATLTALGVLTSWSNGYHRFYRANRDHRLFSHLLAIVLTSTRLAKSTAPAHRQRRPRKR